MASESSSSGVDWSRVNVGKWSLRLRIFLFFALLAAASVASVVAGAIFGASRVDPAAPDGAFVLAAIVACFAILGVTTWIWLLFDENVARPLISIASDLRARAHADVSADLDAAAARYLGDLAPAAIAMSSELASSRADLDVAIERERARLLAERARLDAILRDAPFGCLVCNRDHRIALYNRQAVDQLHGLGDVGLGRRVFELVREAPILAALERLNGRNDDAATDLLCTTRDGAHTLQARMRLFAGGAEAEYEYGYLLTFRDVTEELGAHARRETLLRDVFDRLQRPAANLHVTVDALRTPEAAAPETRAKLQAAVIAETADLAQAVSTLRRRYVERDFEWWPMADAPASDVLQSVQARIASDGIEAQVDAAPIAVRCDGFAIARLLGDLAAAIPTPDHLTLSAAADGDDALIDLTWSGPVLPIGALEALLDQPLSGGYGDFTRRDCLRSHRADVWPESAGDGLARLRLPLQRAADEPGAAAPSAERAAFHDLALLLDRADGGDRPLSSLDFVVFDTETTGLEPWRGDEVVQIAAVRIVNNRLLLDDRFETLVDPERPIPPAATAIHGVAPEMVHGAPTIAEAGAKFHQYCGESALIAHNARFDLAFFSRHAERIGASFDHPVLDTVLMSAILFGQGAAHDLDSVAARLGVEPPGEARHTALGDAIATAECARKMIAMLEGKGVSTLAEYERAAAPHQEFLARGSTG